MACSGAVAVVQDLAPESAPDLLTFDELLQLSETAEPQGALAERLHRLLYTPFVSNQAARRGARPKRPVREPIGPVVRATMWNIERGSEFDLIRLAFSDPDAFIESVNPRVVLEPAKLTEIRRQAAILAGSDVLILNEVDLGMTRTDYRDVARELAGALGMNYVYGVEFVEVDKIELGVERLDLPDDATEERLAEEMRVDRQRYRGLHGSAVLSRYPIAKARIHRFPICYDWYRQEKEAIANIEKARRWTADRLFLERISREVRHGGRISLIVDLIVPGSPTGAVTVLAPHLENKTQPQCRQQQMETLLDAIKEVENPVILGGDLNTTNADAAPTTIKREIAKRVKNPKFWARESIRWFTPVVLPRLFLMPANYFKNFRDPTATHIPLFATNYESGLFKKVEDFRFADGRSFDFRGDPERTSNARGSTLANSNDRGAKGFIPTFAFQRDFKGLIGRMRLDWILVAPLTRRPRESSEPYRFAPHFAQTMELLNESIPGRISDHHPIMVDLPFQEPPPLAGTLGERRRRQPAEISSGPVGGEGGP
jgi:endonuclease/exonuclease/phosphatase family metal-dependent hydrolase